MRHLKPQGKTLEFIDFYFVSHLIMTAFTDRQLAKFSNSAPTASSYRSIEKKSNIRNFSPISDVMLYASGHSVRKSVFILILQACSCWTHDNKINADNSNICYVQSQDVWYEKIGKKQYQRKSPKLNFELTYMFARPDPPRHEFTPTIDELSSRLRTFLICLT